VTPTADLDSNLRDNPLLRIGAVPDFDKVEPAHVRPAIDHLIAESKRALDAIASQTGPRTYENTLDAMDEATEALSFALGIVGHLESVATTPALRDVYNAVMPEVSAFYTGIALDDGLYRALRAYAETAEAKALTGARARHLERSLDAFRRQGAELDPAGKTRLREIATELTKVTNRFSQNVLDATNAWEMLVTDQAQLAGIPQGALDAAKAAAIQRGKPDAWRFTLAAPSYMALMTYADDASLRERAWRAYNTRATSGETDNRSLVGEILRLRRERAKLLGYRDFADLVLADRMAKNGETARAFVDDLSKRTAERAAREQLELEAFRREIEGAAAKPIAPWDVAYYAEKLRRARFDLDEEALRPYFPPERVVDGLFATVARLYELRVDPADLPVWHESVRAFAIREGDRLIGHFWADLYPRESKRDGAWMKGLWLARPGEGSHLGLIAANVTPPVKPGEGGQAGLTHREVETLFHEFGHLLHHMLSRVVVRALAGTRVAWDFVELPSQIMENWCWEREALDLFARRGDDGSPLPTDLFDRMTRARTFRGASAQMRQLGFATVDLALHREYDPARDGDAIAFARKVMTPFQPVAPPDHFAMIASFGHLFGSSVGYAAAYYSYKWAEVLDADAFTRFREKGVFDPEVGRAFRATILAKGDTEDPAVLFRAFMGRDPKPDALLARTFGE
jgi:oligopeptidase A